MKKLGFTILVLVWPLSYYLKHINPLAENVITPNGYDLNQLIVDYFITFSYCIGTSIIAYLEAKKESIRWIRHMFWYVIFAMGVAIVLIYIIDLTFVLIGADAFFGTKKLLWSIIICGTASLCIYLFKRN